MNSTPLFAHRSAISRAICLLVVGAHVSVFAEPAQTPLLTASAGPKPNVVLTLDDSGSMNWHMMPTEVGQEAVYREINSDYTEVTYTRRSSFRNSSWRTVCLNYFTTNTVNPIVVPPRTAPPTSPNNIRGECYTSTSRLVDLPSTYERTTTRYQFYPRIHPSDHDGGGRNTSGVIESSAVGFNGVDNLFGARFRSSDINGNYYNPNVVYEPWPASVRNISGTLINSDGSIKDYTKVPLYPEGAPSGATVTTVDLKNDVTVSTRWCASGMTDNGTGGTFAVDTSTTIDRCPSVSRTFSPAVYFKRISGDGTSAAHFQRININSATDIPDATERAFQQKNFAIWFTYYRNRILTAKGAVGLAFDEQKDSAFRLGYGRINRGITLSYVNGNLVASKTTQSVDGYDSLVMVQGVRSFNDKTTEKYRSSFMTWLRNLPANGGTPLRMAMNDVGRYYSTASPYRTDPSSSSGAELSCRRNFHILVTDGYWNDPSSEVSITNSDNTSGTKYTTPDGTFSYQYAPKSPYQDGASKTLADVAMQYWKTDLRTGLANDLPVTDEVKANPDSPDNNPAFWQHMVNFTVGLGVSGSIDKDSKLGTFSWPTPAADENTTIDDLWHAAVNSRGKYLSARDPIGFSKSLSSILSNITSTGGTISGVAVSRASLASNTLKFEPTFEPEKWSGDVTAIQLNATTGAEASTAWKASQSLPVFSKRNLWMATSGTAAAEFTLANLSGTTPLGHIRTEGGTGVAPTLNEALVNYLRGDSSNEASDKFRPRKTFTVKVDGADVTKTNVLGSMLNSVPLYVKGADFGNRFLPASVNGKETGSSKYNAFLTTKRARDGLVVIGSNDGMLHGFRGTDGVEMFGFIPNAVLKGETHPNSSASDLYGLARLADPNYEHQLYVDGQLAEGDIYACAGSGCGWRNIVVGSTGGGGKSVFAIDVTNNFSGDKAEEPDDFDQDNFLWEFSGDADLGYVMSPPEIGLLPSGKWVAVFGNGYDSASGKAVLFMLDAQTGELVKKITAGSETGNGLGGVRLVRGIDNVIRHAYAGDQLGNVWKFNLTDEVVDLGGTPLFKASHEGTAQPIMATPNYALHPKKGLMVIVPTGKLYSTADQSNTQHQTIYGLWDQAAIGQASAESNAIAMDKLASKVVQGSGNTFSIVNDGSAPKDARGWRLQMVFADGERGIYMPLFIGEGYTYVETVKPGQLETESCSIAEGSGYGYLINTITGEQSSSPIVDINGDGKIDDNDNFGVFKRSSVGRGSVLAGQPGKRGVVVGDGGGNVTQPTALEVDRYWRQIFWTIR